MIDLDQSMMYQIITRERERDRQRKRERSDTFIIKQFIIFNKYFSTHQKNVQ